MRTTLRNGNLSYGIFLVLLFATLAQAQEKKTAENPTPSSSLLEEARSAIDKGNRQWIEGWEKGDAAMVAAIFAEDGMWLGSKGKVHKGYQQILERVKAGIKYVGAGVKITVTTTSLWVDGETAFETGKYVYKYQTDGKPATDEGRYATIWKRQKDGSWKLYLDMPVP
jgi:uncharacterized protein (TIGR02246 family)